MCCEKWKGTFVDPSLLKKVEKKTSKDFCESIDTFDDDKYLVASCTLEGFIQTEWKLCLIALEHSLLTISPVVPAFKRVWSIQLAICSESIF